MAKRNRGDLDSQRDRSAELYDGICAGPWQTAHIVPPLLRFLKAIEEACGQPLAWDVSGIGDPFEPVTSPVSVSANISNEVLIDAIPEALKREKHFRRDLKNRRSGIGIKHQLGWSVALRSSPDKLLTMSISDLALLLDPLASDSHNALLADLHLHTAWSDGNASVNTMAMAVVENGLRYFAVTDHSRSSKLQGGLTPVLWRRQANALTLASPVQSD